MQRVQHQLLLSTQRSVRQGLTNE